MTAAATGYARAHLDRGASRPPDRLCGLHCPILRIGSSITIEDLGSANGTRVRGEVAPATRPIAVEVGDVIDTGAVLRVGGLEPHAIDVRFVAATNRDLEALDRCGSNQTRAAKLLGMPRGTLVTRLGKYDVPRPRKA